MMKPSTGEDAERTGNADLLDIVEAAAIEAEFETGRREETVREARQHVAIRILRMVAGFSLIIAGIAAFVLPGSAWVLIILGLSMLPFAWAQRWVRLIRQKIPGIPAEGRIPVSTWVIMGTTMVLFMALSIAFGDDITSWIRSLGDSGSLFS